MEARYNVKQWCEDNKSSFDPPVCNKLMHKKQLSVMFVGGPNQRKDFHLDEGSEFFFQFKVYPGSLTPCLICAHARRTAIVTLVSHIRATWSCPRFSAASESWLRSMRGRCFCSSHESRILLSDRRLGHLGLSSSDQGVLGHNIWKRFAGESMRYLRPTRGCL